MATPQQKATVPDDSQGAPVGFSGPVFPNPDNIQPRLDTDPMEPTRLPKGVSFQHDNWSGPAPMDISNPPAADVIPTMGREASANFGGKASDPFASIAKPSSD